MKKTMISAALLAVVLTAGAAMAGEHPGKEFIEKNGYNGPATCEECHKGAAKNFLNTVHWKHASKVTNVVGKNIDPSKEYGMKNRIYSFCNGNDTVNRMKEIPKNEVGKSKIAGCNTCHPGNELCEVGSCGVDAENSIDCLICHTTNYDYSKRKPFKNDKGQVVMGQDRSKEAALAVGKPTVKNCMTCHESAGGGVLIKRGFAFNKENDAHAAKGMVCVDCHKAKDHKIPTGTDPNNWANDGVMVACLDCHTDKPHKDAAYNQHTAKVACQTCHIPFTGGAVAKDFTVWEKQPNKFYEPTTLKRGVQATKPVYAWFNGKVLDSPQYIGPHPSANRSNAKIYPFKIYYGKAFFNKETGDLLSMDFAPPLATGDARAGVASAAKILGMKDPEMVAKNAVTKWQTVYFANSHLVTKEKALNCENCHAVNGVLNFTALGYSEKDVKKLTNADLYFDKAIQIQKSKED